MTLRFFSTHWLCFSVWWWVRQGVVWLHRARGSFKESSSSVALQGRGHRTLDRAGWDLWIFWSSELELELEGSCELEPRGLVARLGVNLNLRLCCNLGCFYMSVKGPHWWATRALHECFFMQCCSWGCLHNGVYKKLNKCLSLRNVFITLLGILF